jgi:hypothetical protein
MNPEMQNAQMDKSHEKKAYTKPTLVNYGTLRTTTMAQTFIGNDDGGPGGFPPPMPMKIRVTPMS